MFEILRKSGQRRVVGEREEERKKEGFWRLVLKELWPERKKALFWHHLKMAMGFPGGASGKEPACRCRRQKRCGFDPWVKKIPWRRAWQPTPVFLPGKSHGQRSLAGDSPWGLRESDMTEVRMQTHTQCLIQSFPLQNCPLIFYRSNANACHFSLGQKKFP